MNGKRNWKGKEYEYDQLIFEEEYKDGKRNGKGREYDGDNITLEGEYLNGKIYNIKMHDYKNNIPYQIKMEMDTL